VGAIEKKNACYISNSMQQAQRKDRPFQFYKLCFHYFLYIWRCRNKTAGRQAKTATP